ncbi:hypothetical protein PR048_026855 [Dryococelus australis]|uniref:Uncharacterized protein n=1 Tax=Dryococelus australis TaxID=614101 RepID=A0ABQ9GMG5_9NEOP|nr:hypothetical protein PR048_026855 [Dryococelus australis]
MTFPAGYWVTLVATLHRDVRGYIQLIPVGYHLIVFALLCREKRGYILLLPVGLQVSVVTTLRQIRESFFCLFQQVYNGSPGNCSHYTPPRFESISTVSTSGLPGFCIRYPPLRYKRISTAPSRGLPGNYIHSPLLRYESISTDPSSGSPRNCSHHPLPRYERISTISSIWLPGNYIRYPLPRYEGISTAPAGRAYFMLRPVGHELNLVPALRRDTKGYTCPLFAVHQGTLVASLRCGAYSLHSCSNTYIHIVMSESQYPHEHGTTDQDDTACEALKYCDSSLFPNLTIMLQIFGTTALATNPPERSFSGLRQLKTYLSWNGPSSEPEEHPRTQHNKAQNTEPEAVAVEEERVVAESTVPLLAAGPSRVSKTEEQQVGEEDVFLTQSELVTVQAIPRNGDSQFASLAHQILRTAVGSPEHKDDTAAMRSLASKQLFAHKDAYWDMLVATVAEHGGLFEHLGSSEDQVEALLYSLQEPGFPAGYECVHAVADAAGVHVIVYVGDGREDGGDEQNDYKFTQITTSLMRRLNVCLGFLRQDQTHVITGPNMLRTYLHDPHNGSGTAGDIACSVVTAPHLSTPSDLNEAPEGIDRANKHSAKIINVWRGRLGRTHVLEGEENHRYEARNEDDNTAEIVLCVDNRPVPGCELSVIWMQRILTKDVSNIRLTCSHDTRIYTSYHLTDPNSRMRGHTAANVEFVVDKHAVLLTHAVTHNSNGDGMLLGSEPVSMIVVEFSSLQNLVGPPLVPIIAAALSGMLSMSVLKDIHGHSSAFLLQPFHQFSNGFWQRLTSLQPAIQFVPKMFYRVEVGALGGPVQSADIVVIVLLNSSRSNIWHVALSSWKQHGSIMPLCSRYHGQTPAVNAEGRETQVN